MKHKSTLKRVLHYIAGYRLYLAASLLLAVLTVALTLYAPVLTGDAIDYMIGEGRVDFGALGRLLVQLGVVIGATSLFQWLMNLCNNHMTYKVVMDVRTEAFDHMQDLPLSYIDSHPQGDIVSRLVADIDQFSDGLLMGFTQLFTGVMTILGTLLFMLSVNVGITLVVVCVTPVSFLVASFIARSTHKMFLLQSETRGELTSLIDEMVGNQKVVRAFGYEDEAVSRFGEINQRLEKHSLRAIFFSSITNPSTRFVNSLVYAGVGVSGAVSAIRGGLTVGQLSIFLSYANQYTKPFNEISGVVTELQNALACAARVFDFIDQEPMTPDAEAGPIIEKAKGQVDLEDVAFSYTKDRELIRDLNLHVEPGQRVAIVGPTGCGKSTLINLLMRFYDVDSGSIAVDGCGEHRLRKAGRHGRGDYRGSQGRPCPQLYPPPAGGLRYGAFGGRGQSVPGAEAAFVHHPGDALPAAHAHPRRGDLLHRHPHGAEDPERLREDDGGPDQLHCGPPPVYDQGGRPDPGHAGRPYRRAGHP